MTDDWGRPGGPTRITWRKSRHSDNSGNCVEVAPGRDRVAVRDSKRPRGDVLLFSSTHWDAFISGTKSGEFDLG
ncbi:hypothetical protein GCM10012275_03280 [Longimycelium tulufanense]|uniref:DUF397 domain-containing protein n=1 Tax=Longimycelium tulufanense TaxID=907463 RepID=A0A8J3FUI5_9PSEU|nr:DUF397 domain-containing protein [Longimycelium tulufanense]GGM35353.1 hypothetical protein GCM10012275_03280 [Longimycelium tulufanense]